MHTLFASLGSASEKRPCDQEFAYFKGKGGVTGLTNSLAST